MLYYIMFVLLYHIILHSSPTRCKPSLYHESPTRVCEAGIYSVVAAVYQRGDADIEGKTNSTFRNR